MGHDPVDSRPWELNVWEVRTGKVLRTLCGHSGEVTCLAFSPDGRLLASGGRDTTVLLWDLMDLEADAPFRMARELLFARSPGLAACLLAAEDPSRTARQLRPSEWDDLWANLGAADPRVAARSFCNLAALPDQTIPFLRAQLRPASAVPPRTIAQLVADLDDDRFVMREVATKELLRLGIRTEPAVRRARQDPPSLEARRRLDTILEELTAGHPGAQALRDERAIQILERIGSTEACQVLRRLATGAATADTTQDAQRALQRLERSRRFPCTPCAEHQSDTKVTPK